MKENFFENSQDVVENWSFLQSNIAYQIKELAQYDRLRCRYLSAQEKIDLTAKIHLAQTHIQYKLDAMGHDPELTKNLKNFATLLEEINPQTPPTHEEVNSAIRKVHLQKVGGAVQTIKYVLLNVSRDIHQWFNQAPNHLVDFQQTQREFLGNLNFLRLYWVWGGSFVSAVISFVPDGSFGDLPQGLTVYGYGAGPLSYGLYFYRFAWECLALTRLVFIGPWMTKGEKAFANALTPTQRFQFQGNERKFPLLNDAPWSVVNCLSAVKFFGNKTISPHSILTLGDIGNYLGGAFFFWDVIIALLIYFDAKSRHQAAIDKINKELQLLRDQLNIEEDTVEKRKLNMRLAYLQSLKENEEKVWVTKEKEAFGAVVYSIALFLSFMLSCTGGVPTRLLLVHVSPTIVQMSHLALTCAVAGALFSFVFTMIYQSYIGYLAYQKEQEEIAALQTEVLSLLDQFNALKSDAQDDQFTQLSPEDKLLKLQDLYLQINRKLVAKRNQESAKTGVRILINIAAQTLFPFLLMLSFHVLALWPAVILIISVMSALLMAYLCTYLLEQQYRLDTEVCNLALLENKQTLALTHFEINQEEDKYSWVDRWDEGADKIISFVGLITQIIMMPVIGLSLAVIKLVQTVIDFVYDVDESQLENSIQAEGEAMMCN